MKRPPAVLVFALSLASSLSVLAPARLQAQLRDVGTGTNPAATHNQTPPPDQGQTTADLTPDHTGLLDTGDTADRVVVIGSLDEKRNDIVPNLGATSYGISQNQIANQSQGSDASFNQTLLRVPGCAQDSYGQLHVRGEHANLQFRINDVLLPEGIAGFGQELDTRFVDSLQVITGSLPAQYGIRTAGIIDIHTKSGAFNNGDELGFYGGSYNTYRPSGELAGTTGNFSYFFTGDFLENGIGIESPDGKDYPIHDHTEQFHGFGYMQYVIDKTSRISLILSGYEANFQIPNNPGQDPAFGVGGRAHPAGQRHGRPALRPRPVCLHAPRREPERAKLLCGAGLPEIRREPRLPAVDLHPGQFHPFPSRRRGRPDLQRRRQPRGPLHAHRRRGTRRELSPHRQPHAARRLRAARATRQQPVGHRRFPDRRERPPGQQRARAPVAQPVQDGRNLRRLPPG